MSETGKSSEIHVDVAPAIPGLCFRRFEGEDDYRAMWDVHTRSNIGYGLDEMVMSYDKFRHANSQSANYDPQKDLILAEINGELVAYMKTMCRRELDGTYVNFHSIQQVPEWRGKGIDRVLLRWIDSHAAEVHSSRESGSKTVTNVNVHMNEQDLVPLLESEDYTPVRFAFEMQTDDLDHIPDAPMPEGLEIRPAVPADYMKIIRASVEAFKDEWGAVEMTDADIERWLKNPQHQPEMWVVAWDGDEVAGSILNFIDHARNERTGLKVGFTEFIGVGRPWRKRGLARAMLSRSMHIHKEAGMTQTELGVDADNLSGALRLYESMGYKVVSRETTYRKTL